MRVWGTAMVKMGVKGSGENVGVQDIG